MWGHHKHTVLTGSSNCWVVMLLTSQKGQVNQDCTFADISRITQLLGWKPQVEFDDGVNIMLDNIACLEHSASLGS